MSLHQSAQYEKALPILIQLSLKYKTSNDDYSYALCQLKLADIIRIFGGPNLALEMFEANEKFISVKLETDLLVLAENYLAKSEAYFDLNDYGLYKESILTSIELKKQLKGEDGEMVHDLMLLSRYYLWRPNERDSALMLANKALLSAKSDVSKFTYLIPRIYNVLGFYYHILYHPSTPDQKAFYASHRKSRDYYELGLRAIRNQKTPDKLNESKILHNLGNSYNDELLITRNRETLDKALHYYRKSVNLAERFGSPGELSVKNWVIGKAYTRFEDLDSALIQFHKGLCRLIPDNCQEENLRALPILQPTLNDPQFITMLTMKANSFYANYLRHNDRNDLQSAYQYYLFTLRFHRYLLDISLNEKESIHWGFLYSTNPYTHLIETAFDLYTITNDITYLKNIYGIAANAKYASLNQNDIPPFTTNAIAHAMADNETRLIVKNISLRIPSLSESLLLSVLPKAPKEGDQGKPFISLDTHVIDTLSAFQLQNQMKETNAALIDFHLRYETLYAVIITKDSFQIIKQRFTKELKDRIWKLNKNMVISSPGDFTKLSHSIYSEVLDSVLMKIPLHIGRLIICPDNIVQNIPWEALVVSLKDTTSYKSLDYLLNHFSVRTVLTPSHLLKAKGERENTFYGIASEFNYSKRFSEIQFSTELVNHKAQLFEGTLLKSFPSEPVNSTIFHVAGHMKSDPLKPYNSTFYFNDDDSITITQLEKLSIKTNLAILNACTTGSGTFLDSEGTISFARTFHRMGAESVIMTLWSIDDKTTADILESFYKEMETGNPLDVSLNQSKINFIKNVSTDELANPYYWSGIQLSGKADPILDGSYSWKIFSGAISAVLLVFAVYFLRVRKPHHLFKRF